MEGIKFNLDLIPEGRYCYTRINGERIPCPYWSIHPDKEEQNNGYCAYLGSGDWEDGWGLLWDQVKACSVNLGKDYE